MEHQMAAIDLYSIIPKKRLKEGVQVAKGTCKEGQ
jgi:hypothetical protein